MPCKHSGEWRFSSTHTHTLSTIINGHEWSAHARPPPCSLNRRLGGNQNWHGHIGIKKNLFLCQESNYDTSAFKPVDYSIYQLCYLSSV